MSVGALSSRSTYDRTRVESGPEAAAAAALPVIDSRTLFQGRKEVCIRHGGQLYRLLLTRNDKLILNK